MNLLLMNLYTLFCVDAVASIPFMEVSANLSLTNGLDIDIEMVPKQTMSRVKTLEPSTFSGQTQMLPIKHEVK